MTLKEFLDFCEKINTDTIQLSAKGFHSHIAVEMKVQDIVKEFDEGRIY